MISEKELESLVDEKWNLVLLGKIRAEPGWLMPIPSSKLKLSSDMSGNEDKLEKSLDRALTLMKKRKRIKNSKILNEGRFFKGFDNMVDRITANTLNKNKNQIGVFTMNKESVNTIATELMKSGVISLDDTIKIERCMNKGIPLRNDWADLIKAKMKKEDDKDEHGKVYEADDEDYDYDDDDEYNKTEAEFGEEEESEEDEKKVNKRKSKVRKVEYESDMKSEMLLECTVLCKSNKISLSELILTESRLNKGLELPKRVANIMGIEYEDEDELLKGDSAGRYPGDTVDYNQSSNYRQPTEERSIATPGEEFGDEGDFNQYFGLTQEEALDRNNNIFRDGKIDIPTMTKIEGRIRKNLPLPKGYEKFFKKGNWLH